MQIKIKHGVASRRKPDAEARRIAIMITLAVLGILLFGLLWGIFVGPLHRHERH